jgi:hypothetical protein
MTLVLAGIALSSCAATAPESSSPSANPADGPIGPLRAPGGPWLLDRTGRTVLLHGVDLVYKVPPY